MHVFKGDYIDCGDLHEETERAKKVIFEPRSEPVLVTTEHDHAQRSHQIHTLTDTEAKALGLATDEAAHLHIDELIALLGTDLVQRIGERSSGLPKHIQLIAARVALEKGLDPIQCLDELDSVLGRMGEDSAFADQVRNLGKQMGAPVPRKFNERELGSHLEHMNRHERRAARAQARRKC